MKNTKIEDIWGTWVAQSVKRQLLISAQVTISGPGIEPALGSALSGESAWGFSPFLCPSPPLMQAL